MIRQIKKQLAAKEDLLLGVGQVSQERASGFVNVTKINATHLQAPYVVDTIADLVALDTQYLEDKAKVQVLGFNEINDGGGGLFYYNSSRSTDDHNGGTIIDPRKAYPASNWYTPLSNTASGCFERIYEGGLINIKWFGVKETDDLSIVINTLDYDWFIPKGTYKVLTDLIPKGDIISEGASLNFENSSSLILKYEGKKIKDLRIYNALTGVKIQNSYLILKELNMYNCTKGLWFKYDNAGVVHNIIENVSIFNSSDKAIHIDGEHITALYFKKVVLIQEGYPKTHYGLYINSGAAHQAPRVIIFTECDFSGFEYDIYFDSNSSYPECAEGITFYQCYLEGSDNPIHIPDNSYGPISISFISCNIDNMSSDLYKQLNNPDKFITMDDPFTTGPIKENDNIISNGGFEFWKYQSSVDEPFRWTTFVDLQKETSEIYSGLGNKEGKFSVRTKLSTSTFAPQQSLDLFKFKYKTNYLLTAACKVIIPPTFGSGVSSISVNLWNSSSQIGIPLYFDINNLSSWQYRGKIISPSEIASLNNPMIRWDARGATIIPAEVYMDDISLVPIQDLFILNTLEIDLSGGALDYPAGILPFDALFIGATWITTEATSSDPSINLKLGTMSDKEYFVSSWPSPISYGVGTKYLIPYYYYYIPTNTIAHKDDVINVYSPGGKTGAGKGIMQFIFAKI